MIRPNSKSGFTTLELLIAAAITATVTGALILAMDRANEMFHRGTVVTNLNMRSNRALHRISQAVLGASPERLIPSLETPDGATTVWSSVVGFEIGGQWNGGAVTWDAPQQIAWQRDPNELDNDLDDDGDGLVDEGSVVLTIDVGTPEERSVTIANGVSEYLEGEVFNGVDDNGNGLVDEPGLSFDIDNGTLNVRLSMESGGARGATIVRTQETAVWLRNTE